MIIYLSRVCNMRRDGVIRWNTTSEDGRRRRRVILFLPIAAFCSLHSARCNRD